MGNTLSLCVDGCSLGTDENDFNRHPQALPEDILIRKRNVKSGSKEVLELTIISNHEKESDDKLEKKSIQSDESVMTIISPTKDRTIHTKSNTSSIAIPASLSLQLPSFQLSLHPPSTTLLSFSPKDSLGKVLRSYIEEGNVDLLQQTLLNQSLLGCTLSQMRWQDPVEGSTALHLLYYPLLRLFATKNNPSSQLTIPTHFSPMLHYLLQEGVDIYAVTQKGETIWTMLSPHPILLNILIHAIAIVKKHATSPSCGSPALPPSLAPSTTTTHSHTTFHSRPPPHTLSVHLIPLADILYQQQQQQQQQHLAAGRTDYTSGHGGYGGGYGGRSIIAEDREVEERGIEEREGIQQLYTTGGEDMYSIISQLTDDHCYDPTSTNTSSYYYPTTTSAMPTTTHVPSTNNSTNYHHHIIQSQPQQQLQQQQQEGHHMMIAGRDNRENQESNKERRRKSTGERMLRPLIQHSSHHNHQNNHQNNHHNHTNHHTNHYNIHHNHHNHHHGINSNSEGVVVVDTGTGIEAEEEEQYQGWYHTALLYPPTNTPPPSTAMSAASTSTPLIHLPLHAYTTHTIVDYGGSGNTDGIGEVIGGGRLSTSLTTLDSTTTTTTSTSTTVPTTTTTAVATAHITGSALIGEETSGHQMRKKLLPKRFRKAMGKVFHHLLRHPTFLSQRPQPTTAQTTTTAIHRIGEEEMLGVEEEEDVLDLDSLML